MGNRDNGDAKASTDESTPLLGAEARPAFLDQEQRHQRAPSRSSSDETLQANDTDQQEQETQPENKPFDFVQIFFLCYVSLAEPIAFFSIFPYINEMIYRTGDIAEADVGFWSGLIESLFSLVQMLLMIFYGRMADRLGRKPVLVFSQFGVSIAVALFGLSRTVWQMVLLRCLAGMFAGSVVTVRVMLSENCDKAGQARAFSWYMFTRNVGIFLGPIIGGVLARPADLYPGAFGHIQFFHDYPYALPGFVTGTFCLTTTAASLFILRETLVRDKTSIEAHAEPPMSTWGVVKAPGVAIVLLIFGQVALHGLAFTAMTPLSWFTSIQNGGFSFPERYIAAGLAICGLCQSLFMLLAFPPLHRRFGTGPILRVCAMLWPVLFLSFPLFNQFRRNQWETQFWIVAPIVWALGSGVSIAFTCTQLCINDVSPSHQVLATTNALALTVNSAVRAVVPVVFTSIYAIGVRKQILAGNLGWFVLSLVSACLPVLVRWLPEAAEGRPERKKKAVDETEPHERNS